MISQLARKQWEPMYTIMKYLMTPGTSFLLLCLATVFSVTACSTTGMQRSEEVQSSLQTVDNDIKLIVVQLDAIGASLDELTKPGQADMKKAFDVFSENTSKIAKMEKNFDKHADDMESSGKAYFSEWEKNSQKYDNPDIQKRSSERLATLGSTYDKIALNNIGVKGAFQVYVSDVNEIERFLSNDLTNDGVDSITPISDNAVKNGAHLKNELQNLQKAIEEARSKMKQD
jgi:hypothetical protein